MGKGLNCTAAILDKEPLRHQQYRMAVESDRKNQDETTWLAHGGAWTSKPQPQFSMAPEPNPKIGVGRRGVYHQSHFDLAKA